MKLLKALQTKLILPHSSPKQICCSLVGSFLSLTEQHWPGCGKGRGHRGIGSVGKASVGKKLQNSKHFLSKIEDRVHSKNAVIQLYHLE